MLHGSACSSRRTAPRAPRSRRSTLAQEIGYPLVVRPSYVLGGRAMEIVHEQQRPRALHARGGQGERRVAGAARPFSQRRDRGRRRLHLRRHARSMIGGIMEHIEQAGVHSGDSACSLPPYSLPPSCRTSCAGRRSRWRTALNVVGLMNVQFAIQGDAATARGRLRARGQPARVAHRAVRLQGDGPAARQDRRALHGRADRSPAQRRSRGEVVPPYFSVKEAVFPFIKFPGVDTILGPEMKSTGEVMGVGAHLRRGDPEEPARRRGPAADRGHGRSSASRTATSRARSTVARELHDLGFNWSPPAARRRRSPRRACR